MGQRVWVNNKGEMETSSLTICDAQPVDSDDYYCELTWDKGAQEGADSEYIKRQLLQFRVRVSGMKAWRDLLESKVWREWDGFSAIEVVFGLFYHKC